MATEYFYGGKAYSLDPSYGNPIAYGIPFSSFSSAIDPRTANQIKEASETLNTGIKNVEVGAMSPEVFDSIPKQHFKEMNRLAKLTGAELSFHAPMIDPTGITEHGFEEMNRKAAEEQLWSSIEKANELNPKGTVVTFHATSAGLPPAELKIKEGKEEKVKSVLYIDRKGKIGQIREEEKYYGSKDGKPVPFNPDEELRRINEDSWMETLSNLNFHAHRGAEAIGVGVKEAREAKAMEITANLAKKEIQGEEKENLEMLNQEATRNINHGKIYLRDSYRYLRELYNQIYKDADSKTKEKLQEYYHKVKPYITEFDKLEQNPDKLKEFSKVIEEGVKTMGEIKDIKIVRPLKEFAVEKSAETTANIALRGYKRFKDNAPIIALENHPANQSILTTGEDLRNVIEKSQKMFVEKAVKEGMSRGEAEKQAKKLIGATWDVGHINMLRMYGYDKSDVVKETEKIAPHVKKIHLSDNFGFQHTELPMGMGNVPMKEIMEKIGKEGYDVKKVIEAGNWWQHFSPGGKINPPLVPTMQAFGSPIYGNVGWNQVSGTPGSYFSGYGTMLPDQNFSIYGAGFTSLPAELGGQVQSKDSRFSGTPMS